MRDKIGTKNPNWKGGLSSVRTADQLLACGSRAFCEIERRFYESCKRNALTGCWEWTGHVFRSSGRARMCLGQSILASRISYAIHSGVIGKLCVLHTCDNVLCVNPDHLWLGTNSDNTKDMFIKGRAPSQKGSLNPGAKLNEVQVYIIKTMIREGRPQSSIAREFGVCNAAINDIARGRNWKHII